MEAVFILGVIFAFIIVLVWLQNQKKERRWLLEQGKDPNLAGKELNLDLKDNVFSSVNYLKWSIIIIGIGVGMLVGTFVGTLGYSYGYGNSLYLSCLLIFSGIGIIVSFLVTRRVSSSDKPKEKSEENCNQ